MHIAEDILDRLNQLFYAHRLTIDGIYDGTDGTIYVDFNHGKTYYVDYSYVGDVPASFEEVLRRAVAYAIQVDNIDPTAQQKFLEKVAGIVPEDPDTIHLVLPPQDLWNNFDLDVNLQTTGDEEFG